MLDFQFRRFDNSVAITMVQPEATIVYNKTNKVLIVHDGVTTGGHPLVTEQRVNTLLTNLAQTSLFNSPNFTGSPTAPTQPLATNNDTLSTTKFVKDFILSQKGVATGIAPLNASNKIPNIHLALVADDIPSLSTSKINTGIFDAARLGSGSANSSTFLRGDGTWQIVSATTNLGLGTVNASSITITSSSGSGVTLTSATATNSGLMSSADKSKLDAIPAGAQAYSAGSGITLSGTTFSLTGTSFTVGDKTKLDSIAAGAQVNVPTNLGYTSVSRTITNSNGSAVQLPLATTAEDGLLSAGDKSKLNNTPNFTTSTATPSSGDGTVGDVWFKY